MSSSAAWTPSTDYIEDTNLGRFMRSLGMDDLDELRARWQEDRAWFWRAVSDDLSLRWQTAPTTAVDVSRGPEWADWFPGGHLDLVNLCVERHDPERLALRWEGEEGAKRDVTFGELRSLVDGLAGRLVAEGVRAGDRVGLFMPFTPEAVAIIYACIRINAICVPMFSGFGVDALAGRLRDAGAALLVTGDIALRRGREIPMADTGREAAALAGVPQVLTIPRSGIDPHGTLVATLDSDSVPGPVEATTPFLLVFTSGTTGRPKGAVHAQGGFALKAASEMAYHADQRDGELLFWPTDPGWIVGPWMVLGAGLRGNPLFLYDGAVDFPAPDRVASMLAANDIGVFGTAPSYVRSLMHRDDHGFPLLSSSLRVLLSSAEPWDETSWQYYFEVVGGGSCPVINLSGGTEAMTLLASVPVRPIKPVTFNSTAVGVDVAVLDEQGSPVAPGNVGELAVTAPWPSKTRSFWNDDDRYLETYWSRWPGVWAHGDWASQDSDGHYVLHGRSDDTLMIAGKRVGPSEIETVLCEHPQVLDAGVVGAPHPTKGETMVAFVCVADPRPTLNEELVAHVAARLGKPFRPSQVVTVPRLPRNRSNKVMRRVLRSAYTGSDLGDLSSVDDTEVIDELLAAVATASRVAEAEAG
jgi:acetyl-CoA synthetase